MFYKIYIQEKHTSNEHNYRPELLLLGGFKHLFQALHYQLHVGLLGRQLGHFAHDSEQSFGLPLLVLLHCLGLVGDGLLAENRDLLWAADLL